MEVYQKNILPFVQQANAKQIPAPWRHAYERLIFLILAKEYRYTPKRFVESRLFASLWLKPYAREKIIDLKIRLSQIDLQYADNANLFSIAHTIHQTHWHDIGDLDTVVSSQHARTKLYNQGAMIGVYGEKGTLWDFLQKCVSARNSKLSCLHWQDGFATFRGVGPLLIEQMELVLKHYGIDPKITAVELDYLATLR